MKLLSLFIALNIMAPLAVKDDDCRKQLKEYSRKASMHKEPTGKQVYFINYEMITTVRPGKGEDSKVNVKVVLGSKGMYYESSYVSMYKDSSEIYTVIHPQKLIVRSKADKIKDASLRKQQLNAMQDTLIDNGTVNPCRYGVYNGSKVKVIELIPEMSATRKNGIEKIIYYLNEQKQSMDGEEIFYTSSSAFLKREIKFFKVDYESKEKLKSKAREYLYDGQKLKATFKGYRVEDNRE